MFCFEIRTSFWNIYQKIFKILVIIWTNYSNDYWLAGTNYWSDTYLVWISKILCFLRLYVFFVLFCFPYARSRFKTIVHRSCGCTFSKTERLWPVQNTETVVMLEFKFMIHVRIYTRVYAGHGPNRISACTYILFIPPQTVEYTTSPPDSELSKNFGKKDTRRPVTADGIKMPPRFASTAIITYVSLRIVLRSCVKFWRCAHARAYHRRAYTTWRACTHGSPIDVKTTCHWQKTKTPADDRACRREFTSGRCSSTHVLRPTRAYTPPTRRGRSLVVHVTAVASGTKNRGARA